MDIIRDNGGIKEKSDGEKIFNQSIFYSSSLYMSMFLQFLRGLVVAKFLGPLLFGLRTAFFVAIDFEKYSQLGTYEAMAREVPFFRGGKEQSRVEEIERSVFGFNMLISLSLCLVLILLSLYVRMGPYDVVYADFIFFLGLLIVTNKVINFYTIKFVVDKEIIFLGKMQVLHAVVNTGACIILVYFYSLRGLFMGLLLADITAIGFILTSVRRFHPIRISFPVIKDLIKIGLPIILVGVLLLVLNSADRIIIISMLSEEMLGYFGIATFVSLIIFTIPQVINRIIFPHYMEKLGKTKDSSQIKSYLIEPIVLLVYFIPFVIAPLYLAIHLPFQYFLTQYLPSIPVAKILTIASFFIPLTYTPLNICFALNKQMKLILIVVPSVLLNVILNFLFISLGFGIIGVAVGTSLSYLLFGGLTLWFSLNLFDCKPFDIFKFFSLVFAPFLYSTCLILLLDGAITFPSGSMGEDLLFTMIKIAIFILLFTPVILLIRNHSAFETLLDNVPYMRKIVSSLSRGQQVEK